MWDWPVIWFCINCGACVGTHKDTDEPLGKMANSNIRFLRAVAHRAFDPIWKLGYKSRDEAYLWMQQELNVSDAHIGVLNELELQQLIDISNDFIEKWRKRVVRNRTRFELSKSEKVAMTLRKKQ